MPTCASLHRSTGEEKKFARLPPPPPSPVALQCSNCDVRCSAVSRFGNHGCVVLTTVLLVHTTDTLVVYLFTWVLVVLLCVVSISSSSLRHCDCRSPVTN
ncbi:hypothetical protein P168DRAFT_154378 [Aspergillus campestris IBT 28561]|uniref:Uncharacterized protein n=1 Tax=Aspergillus campestris (strain IBT 28561) TaxID=1392248 RepID=A0A2I1D303_ASPC2|nr:uncharacterized protein P168DRAFT_154378 [Aspergillus campestris IBT 28561]PKY04228.1 hypothetical protein P168DRAFT_154378 [Aspergillus campestris IBT 28561]